MTQQVQLSSDFSAYENRPAAPKAGLVILQEIFGVNSHIREVADHYADLGFHVIAPALFDPAEKGAELGYDEKEMKKGMQLREKVGDDKALEGVQKAIDYLRQSDKKVFVVGYCWGGSLAFLAACRLHGLDKAVAYYGSAIYKNRESQPKVPVMFHFGEKDHGIPEDQVKAIREAQSPAEVHTYPAGHAFNRRGFAPYDAASAKIAEERSLNFFAE